MSAKIFLFDKSNIFTDWHKTKYRPAKAQEKRYSHQEWVRQAWYFLESIYTIQVKITIREKDILQFLSKYCFGNHTSQPCLYNLFVHQSLMVYH